jgi:hypothetical protein
MGIFGRRRRSAMASVRPWPACSSIGFGWSLPSVFWLSSGAVRGTACS